MLDHCLALDHCLIRFKGGGGVILPPVGFSLNNLDTAKALPWPWHFAILSNVSLETFMPHLVSLTHSCLLYSISPPPFLLQEGGDFQSQILKREISKKKKKSDWRDFKNSCHGYLPEGGVGGGGVRGVCVLVPCQKKTFKIKYGFEGSISNAAVGLF